MKKKILFMLLPALMAISAGTALPTAVFASEGNSENTKELFNPDSAGVDHTWGQFDSPEATWNKTSQTLTIEIKAQSEWQWGNQVFFSTGITTLDTSKEYQFSFTGTASTDYCDGVTFKAFDNNSLVFLNEGLSFTTTPYNYVSEWATPSGTSTNGHIVFDFGWDAAQTVTITNISIKERSKVVSYTISDGTTDLNGIIEIDKSTAAEKELVTITVKPASGYQLKSLTAAAASVMARPITPTQDEHDKTKYTFTMPAHNVKVIAEFEVAATTDTVAEIDCPICHGDGLAQCSECFGLGCSSCNGGNVPCTNCGETGKISFTTLKDAISAVTYYGKITLLKDNSEEIEISEEAVFVIDKGSFTFDKSKITAGTGYDVSTIENDTETTFIVTHQKTIASILPEDFPTFSMPLPSNVWENRNCTTSKLYKNISEGLTFGSVDTFDSFDHILNSPLTKVENGYELLKDSYTIKFDMISNELVSITLSGSAHADINGVYTPHMHVMDHHSGVAPTCTEDGTVEYWTCPNESGVYFANAEGTETLSSIVDPKLGHDMTHHTAVAPSCTEDGTVEYWTCSHESGVYYANEQGTATLTTIVDPKLGHDMEHHEAVAPTCTQDGTVEYWTCSRESGVYFANEEGTATLDSIVDPKIGHHYSGEVSFTWNNNQCTASWHCDHDGCEEVESETVTGVYVKDSDATTESNEKGHYVATFSISEFATNSTAPNSVEIPDSKLSTKGLSGGAIAGIVIGSVFGLLIIAFAVLYVLWKRKNLNVPILSKVLTPAFRFINKLFFKTKLNDVEAKEAENKPMKE